MRRVACALVFALAACLPVSSADSSIILTEFEVEVANRLGPGPNSLEVVNSGEFNHTLVVSTADGRVVASTEVLTPGETVSLEVDLEQGKYQFSCRVVVQIPDGSIVDHYAEGMAATVTVPSS